MSIQSIEEGRCPLQRPSLDEGRLQTLQGTWPTRLAETIGELPGPAMQVIVRQDIGHNPKA